MQVTGTERLELRTLSIIASVLAIMLAGAIVWAASGSSLLDDGGSIIDLRWGVVSLLDLYVGLVLVAGWIVFREPSAVRRAGWLVALFVLGNLATAAYVGLAAWHAHRAGDLRVIFVGHRSISRSEHSETT